LPAFLFYLLGHFNSPGYALLYAGLLAAGASAYAARVLFSGARAAPLLAAAVLVMLLLNTWLFHSGWPLAPRLAQRGMSEAEIRDHDRYYTEVRKYLQSRSPGSVRIL